MHSRFASATIFSLPNNGISQNAQRLIRDAVSKRAEPILTRTGKTSPLFLGIEDRNSRLEGMSGFSQSTAGLSKEFHFDILLAKSRV